ncbi:MAG: repair exonuclease [Fibrobacteres bacterium]|nr:repair exonuclease [Fibrobacterota bacterium]
MPRILHAADLHLSEADRDYSLAVFSELLDSARREKADYLLFCGDLFNTFADAEKLRSEFRRILGSPPFEFLYLPGNHEDLQRGGGELSRLDWGAATVLHGLPFELLRRDRGGVPVEFLAVPHQEKYSGYGNWPVPPKEAAWRVALAHGVVAGMSYRGPDDEGGAAAIDPDLFARFQVDYAALGHIHGRRTDAVGGTRLAYPGSTRVWRRNESGARGALLLDLPASGPASMRATANGGPASGNREAIAEPVFIPLASAGEYRHYALTLTLEGDAPDLDSLAKSWGPSDYIELECAGLVEDERSVVQLADRLRTRYGSKVRCLEIDRDGVSALPGISSQPIVRKFLEAWNARMPASVATLSDGGEEHAVWIRAREMALNSLKAALERVA